MQDIIEQIRKDIELNYRRRGVQHYKKWKPSDTDLELLIQDCVYAMQFKFHKITPEFDTGFCSLTQALMSCGEDARRHMKIDEGTSPSDRELVSDVGSVIISALGAAEYISIKRQGSNIDEDVAKADKSNFKNPWEVQALDKWLLLGFSMKAKVEREFNNLTFYKPSKITESKHPQNGRPVLKRSTQELFDIVADSEHLAAVDILQQTAWEVNSEVLHYALNYEWDDSAPEIPKKGSKKMVDIMYRRLKKDPSVQEAYNQVSQEWEAKRKALKKRSNIMERLMTLTKASSLDTKGALYNLLECDYRGRMYYCESYFHFQGNDLMKGLLQFKEAKPVNERGLYWLKLQAAACFNRDFTRAELKEISWTKLDYVKDLEDQGLEDISLDKMSLNDRAKWVDESIEFILATATNGTIYEDCEYPVMFLATCIEIKRVLEAEKNGEVYHSHLPVAIDGSQNVLQHSSAINLDAATGAKVGLTPTQRPFDIYVEVGKNMAEATPEFFESRNMTMKDIRKNISKRSTMVRNYSAGRKSIAENMYRDCVKNGAVDKYNITPTDCFKLAGVAIKAIDAVVPANKTFRKYLQALVVHEIGEYDYTYPDGSDAKQDWEKLFANYNSMNVAARKKFDTITRTLRSGLGKTVVSWDTPTGFPVVQNLPYTSSMLVRPHIMGTRTGLQVRYNSEIPELEKHKSAIAANFIHSQDATHAARVINAFGGSSFALVHDSFAVHASDVDELLTVTKVEFKKLYKIEGNYYDLIKNNILTDDTEFKKELPETGDLNLDDVDDADYFFS